MRWLPDAGCYVTFNESLYICEVCDREGHIWTEHYALAL
jgi:hypothetical protein